MQLSYIYVSIGVGTIFESEDEHGLSHFVEHCLFSGTNHFKKENEVWEYIEGLGGSINAFTSKDVTTVFCKVLSVYTEKGINLLSDIVLHPTFPLSEVEKEKKVLSAELVKTNSNIAQFAYRALLERLRPKHPVRNDILGTKESIKTFDQDKLNQFHNKFYVPNNISVAVVGPLQHDQVLEMVSSHFSGPAGNIIEAPLDQYKPFKTELSNKNRPGQQAALIVGFRTPNIADQNSLTSSLVSMSLGQLATFGLRSLIRFQKGLAYSVKSGWNGYVSGSFASILIRCETKNIKEIKNITTSFLGMVATKTIRREVLQSIRNAYFGSHAADIEQFDSAARQLSYAALYEVYHTLSLNQESPFFNLDQWEDSVRRNFSNYELIEIQPK